MVRKKNKIPPETLEAKKVRVRQIERRLRKEYPEAETALQYGAAFELLIAVILSAQCTDAQVNKVTPGLFQRYGTVHALAGARQQDVERLIHSTGFYRAKAKNIIACATALRDRFHGAVPQTMEELVQLPGVGRKTANVVLGSAFGKVEGVVVDTHVARLSRRLGLTVQEDPVKIEQDLMTVLPRRTWFSMSHRLILHGRKVCTARTPHCSLCSLSTLCPSSTV